MSKYIAAIALLLCLVSLALSADAQKPDNLRPMYGNVVKTPEYKKIDDKFRDASLAQFGSSDSAVKVYIDAAWRYFYNKDVVTAMKRFNQVWLLDEDCPDAYFGFGALTEIQGKKAEADGYYNTALKKDKATTRAAICYHRIADCAEQVGNIPVTIDALVKLARLRPDFAYPYKKLGYLYMQRKQPENALAAYNTAITLDSTDAVTYRNRGYFYQLQNDYGKAITDYSSSIQADPKAIEGYVS
ncbi:MAG: tetratricopeptide repeat protein, partial [Sphingobacteriales bacterium]